MFVQLTNTAQYAEGMAGAVCIGLMGLRLFAFISQEQKRKICHSLRMQGVTIFPHAKKSILCVGKITVTLLQLTFALMHASVGVVYLVAYGFKAPTTFFSYLEPLQLALGHDLKIDIGKSIKTKKIPVFKVREEFSGTVYPMLYGMKFKDTKICGSVSANIKIEGMQYYSINSLSTYSTKGLNLNADIPTSIVGIRKKLSRIEDIVCKLNQIPDELGGFRFEFCFNGRLSIEECQMIVEEYTVRDSLPICVMKAGDISPSRYLRNLTKVLTEVKSEGLGKGKSGGQVSRAQQSLFARVLNALGFYSTKYQKFNLDKTAMKSRQAKIMEDFKKAQSPEFHSV